MWKERFEVLEEPQKRGQATEALVKAAFVLRDIPVLVPEYDNEPYDFVVELGDSCYRLRAKTGYGGDGTVTFETVSTRTRSDGYDRSDYTGSIDYFVVYNPYQSDIYTVDIAEAATGKMKIRFEPTAITSARTSTDTETTR